MKAAAEQQEDVSLSSGVSISEVEVDVSSRTPELSGLVLSEPELQPRRLSSSTASVTVTAAGATETRQDGHSQAPPTSDPAAVPATDVDDGTYVARCVAVEEELVGAEQCAGAVDSGLEDALGAVVSSLDDYRGQFPELQLLEDELKLLQVNLKVRLLQGTEPAGRAGTLDPGRVWSSVIIPLPVLAVLQGGKRSRSTSLVSLAVETALGSFDFLNASDWEEDEEDSVPNRPGHRSVLLRHRWA